MDNFEPNVDVVSHTVEADPSAVSINFHKHEYSLSDLPPLTELDKLSDESRDFAKKSIEKEQDFRHKLIQSSEDNKSELDLLKEKNKNKQKQIGAYSAGLIIVSTFIWSGYCISNGNNIIGLTPFIIALTGLVAAGIWGRSQNNEADKNAPNNDED